MSEPVENVLNPCSDAGVARLGITGNVLLQNWQQERYCSVFVMAVLYLRTSCYCRNLPLFQTARDCAFNTDKCRALRSAAGRLSWAAAGARRDSVGAAP